MEGLLSKGPTPSSLKLNNGLARSGCHSVNSKKSPDMYNLFRQESVSKLPEGETILFDSLTPHGVRRLESQRHVN